MRAVPIVIRNTDRQSSFPQLPSFCLVPTELAVALVAGTCCGRGRLPRSSEGIGLPRTRFGPPTARRKGGQNARTEAGAGGPRQAAEACAVPSRGLSHVYPARRLARRPGDPRCFTAIASWRLGRENQPKEAHNYRGQHLGLMPIVRIDCQQRRAR